MSGRIQRNKNFKKKFRNYVTEYAIIGQDFYFFVFIKKDNIYCNNMEVLLYSMNVFHQESYE